nr:hypothetical protein SHINE37_60093 [Rhizobiaceae bacterium]
MLGKAHDGRGMNADTIGEIADLRHRHDLRVVETISGDFSQLLRQALDAVLDLIPEILQRGGVNFQMRGHDISNVEQNRTIILFHSIIQRDRPLPFPPPNSFGSHDVHDMFVPEKTSFSISCRIVGTRIRKRVPGIHP